MSLSNRQQDILAIANCKSINQIAEQLPQYFYNNIVTDIFYLINKNYLSVVQGKVLTYMVTK